MNEAVALAGRKGILTCASLMVSAPGAREAVELARELPRLRVGLHLTVVDGLPTLPPEEVGALVGPGGALGSDLVGAGFRFVSPWGRSQLRREIRAQFEAFQRTGLALDHVNAHHHMHLHPTVAALLIEVGQEFGLRAVRVPAEPRTVLEAVGDSPGGKLASRFLSVWVALLKARLRRAGLRFNDWMFGLAWTGALTETRVERLIPHLPPGVSELYCHPTAGDGSAGAAELAALVSPRVAEGIGREGIALSTFGEIGGEP